MNFSSTHTIYGDYIMTIYGQRQLVQIYCKLHVKWMTVYIHVCIL